MNASPEHQNCYKTFIIEHGEDAYDVCIGLRAELPLPQSQIEAENLKSTLTNFGNYGFSAFFIDAKKNDDGDWVDYSGNLVNVDLLSPDDTYYQHMLVYGEHSDWTFGTQPFGNSVHMRALCEKAPQLGKF